MEHVSKRSATSLVVLAIIVVAVSFTIARQIAAEDAAAIGGIKDSYSFDVTDRSQLMDYGDEVFVGRVVDREVNDPDAGVTIWRVQVVASVKGSAAGEVLVRQLGYVDEDGRVHESEEQPLLPLGGTRLLVTTGSPSGPALTLVAGPAASVKAETAQRQRELVGRYAAAAQ